MAHIRQIYRTFAERRLAASTAAHQHDVRLQDFHRWLNTPGRSPVEITTRQRMREILGETITLTDRQVRRHQQRERNR